MSSCEVTMDLWMCMRRESTLKDATSRDGTPANSPAARRALPVRIQDTFYQPNYRGDPKSDDDRYPLAGLTQYGAQEFCRWLSARTGHFYRLPTEAEWEYAARAGTTTRYFFGDDPAKLGEYAWFGGKLDEGAREVGQKRPNPWGLYDIYGNVSEWTLEGWAADYRAAAAKGAAAGNFWTVRRATERFGTARGGDWTGKADALRSAARIKEVDFREHWIDQGHFEYFDASDEGVRVGFRVVSPVEPDREADGRPPRAEYLKPYGWDEYVRDLHEKRTAATKPAGSGGKDGETKR
jgi:formylglycine-generating enzyme required for sulfatase activity